jgi:ubiquinone/menaquinone biosynthesis C-methylase UbiE
MGKKTTRKTPTPADEALRLQTGLYISRNPTRRWLHNSRLDWIIGALDRHDAQKPRQTVLDVGSGSGILLPALARRFDRVISLDIEQQFLRQVKTRPSAPDNIRYLAADARALPLRNNAVDCITCSEVLEHITNGTACLKEFYRTLGPGGLLVLTTPQPTSLLELTAGIVLRRPLISLVKKIYREPVLPTGHINLMSSRRLHEKLVKSGFDIVESHKSGLYLPGLAEIPARASRNIAAALGAKIAGTKLDCLLWTQFFVAQKPSPGRPDTRGQTARRPSG